MSPRRKQPKTDDAVGGIIALIIGGIALLAVLLAHPIFFIIVAVFAAIFGSLALLGKKRRKQEQQERARQRMEEILRKQEERKQHLEQERAEQIEALLERDAFRGTVDDMSGVQFERFMANVFRKKGYPVETTPGSGDQGIDLLVTIDTRRIAIQLKRYVAPVGNKAVQQAFAGMIYYKAKEECPRISAEFLAEEERTLGPRWFRQEYCNSFEETEDSVFDYETVAGAITDDVAPLFGTDISAAMGAGPSPEEEIRPLFGGFLAGPS